MRGAWLGFSWGHTQAHFARAIMESVAYEYAYYLSVLRTLVPDLELTETRVVGGGAASAVWNQIKADVLGVPYQPLRGAEFGTWGAAVVAARAAGLGDDLGEIAHRAVRPAGGPTLPNENNAAIYRSAAQQYVAWQECLRSGFQGEHE
jgi:xylulokinase